MSETPDWAKEAPQKNNIPDWAMDEAKTKPSGETSLGETAYGFGRGVVKSLAGTAGELESFLPSPKLSKEQMGLMALTPGGTSQAVYEKSKEALGRRSLAPTIEDVSKGLSSVGLPPSKATTSEEIGVYAPIIYTGAKGIAAIGKYGLGKVSELVNKAWGKDAEKLAENLRNYAVKRTGAEAENAKKLAAKADEQAKTAQTTAQKQSRVAESEMRKLPGVTTEQEAGRFKPIPTSLDTIGQNIKSQADRIYNNLKSLRSSNAEKLKEEAFGSALAKEKQGLTIADTKAYDSALKYIDDAVRNPETKLSNVPVQSIRSELFQVRDAIRGTAVDAAGNVVEHPPSFQGLETLRRSLRDRAYGLPAQGFDAIGQQQAGKLADQVENIMSEFSDGKIKKFIDQYRKDSEPLRAFQSKIGKALVDEQLLGSGANYAKVSSEQIPGRVFKNRESYQTLIDAFGGNKEFAASQARQYFSQELERLGSDAKKIEKFIAENRNMLDLTGSKGMVENYLSKVKSATGRGEAATTKAKEATKTAEVQRIRQQAYETLQSDITKANSVQDVARLHESFAKKLLNEGTINQQEYRTMLDEANRVMKAAKTKEEAARTIGAAARKILLYSGGGLAASGLYFGGKSILGGE